MRRAQALKNRKRKRLCMVSSSNAERRLRIAFPCLEKPDITRPGAGIGLARRVAMLALHLNFAR
jgi:hypothetical protein